MTLTFILQAALLLFWLTAARTGPAIDAQRWQPIYAKTAASDVAACTAQCAGKRLACVRFLSRPPAPQPPKSLLLAPAIASMESLQR